MALSNSLSYNVTMKKSFEIIGKNRKALNLCLIIANLAVLAILGFVLFQHQNSKVNRMVKTPKNEQVSKGSSSSSKEAKKEDKTQLKKGSNHSIEASDYAYDVTAVNNTIRGKSDDVKGKVVFLTFDDGIDPTLTPQVMDILKEYGVHATFFHIGYTITPENGNILKRQITEGHAIANHSLSHNFNLLYPGRVPNQSQIVSEVNQTNANFQAILGKDFKTRIFRYPGGHMSWQGLESTDHALAKEDIQWIDWNMLCGDAEPLSVRPTTSESMMAYMDGSQKYFPETTVKVVLMHDTAGKELTVQTLPQIIEYFKNQGYTFGVLE
ncbi:Peptidoglycan N-acetylglucosamine deacetylase [Streptococcus salivarius K12]|uniref:Peptidoglycan N-acetylglucosamine deacetylase n=2 Tax=Streptococcus salivarius TaxID=1304 RepID=J7T4S1_STRSL|nr:Peptidoglycan N-acetylglucosamine deacetylase [Streptococcus salivarius K12]